MKLRCGFPFLVGAALALTACGGAHPSTTASVDGAAGSNVIGGDGPQHLLDKLNSYRQQANVGPLILDGQLTTFAQAGDDALVATGNWHGHFQDAGDSIFSQGFCGQAEENQGYWSGDDVDQLIDSILQGMMDEGPGGGHHDNIINPDVARLGVGLEMANGNLYLTNDFSGTCGQ